jgi:hypothetical protein
MNVEIGTEAALFPEKEYINGIAVAVRAARLDGLRVSFDKHGDHISHVIFYPVEDRI